MKKIFFLLATLVVPLFAFAQAVPATATGAAHPYSLGGNVYTFGGAQATAANAATYSYAPAANGSIYTTNVSPIPSASGGAAVPVTVNGSISKAAAAAAVGRFLGKVVGVLAVGVAVYDLAKELGYNVDNSSGAVVVTKTDPSVCTVAPCPEFGVVTQAGTLWGSSSAAVCNASLSNIAGEYGPGNHAVFVSASNAACYANVYNAGNSYIGQAEMIFAKRTVAPNPNASVPSSSQEFADSVAARPVWPPESAIARAVRDAVKSGESVAVNPVSVTGPASVPAAKTVTNNGTSTTTNQTTNNYNYAGNTVTVTNVTNSTTVNNATGATEAQTTTTEEPVAKPEPEPQKDTCGMPGTPACKIDETGTPEAFPSAKYDTAVDPYKATTDTNRATISGAGDKPFFAGWSVFFSAPAIAACAPIVLPGNYGSLNPCPVVDGVRYIMGLLWAAGGLVLCLGMVKQVV